MLDGNMFCFLVIFQNVCWFNDDLCNDVVTGSSYVTNSDPVASTTVPPPGLSLTALPCHSWYYVQALCHLSRYYV